MKKAILLSSLLLPISVTADWDKQNYTDEFNEQEYVLYTLRSTDQKAILAVQENIKPSKWRILIYRNGDSYICSPNKNFVISYRLNNEPVKKLKMKLRDDSKTLTYWGEAIQTHDAIPENLDLWLSADRIRIRTSDTCGAILTKEFVMETK